MILIKSNPKHLLRELGQIQRIHAAPIAIHLWPVKPPKYHDGFQMTATNGNQSYTVRQSCHSLIKHMHGVEQMIHLRTVLPTVTVISVMEKTL